MADSSTSAARLSALHDRNGGYPFRHREFPRYTHAWSVMRVGDVRFNSDDIHRMYESSEYLRRQRIRMD